jgi:hypothetical protein
MSVEVVRGGQRRIDRVLDPRFVAGVGHEGESVSTHRRAVLRVVDLLRGELAAATATAAPTSPSSSSDLPDLLEELKFPKSWSNRDRAGPIAPA